MAVLYKSQSTYLQLVLLLVLTYRPSNFFFYGIRATISFYMLCCSFQNYEWEISLASEFFFLWRHDKRPCKHDNCAHGFRITRCLRPESNISRLFIYEYMNIECKQKNIFSTKPRLTCMLNSDPPCRQVAVTIPTRRAYSHNRERCRINNTTELDCSREEHGSSNQMRWFLKKTKNKKKPTIILF